MPQRIRIYRHPTATNSSPGQQNTLFLSHDAQHTLDKGMASLHNKNPDTGNVPGIWMKTKLNPLHGSPCSLPTVSAGRTAQHQTNWVSDENMPPLLGFLFTNKGWSSGSYTAEHAYGEVSTGSSSEDEFSLPTWCTALTLERHDRRFAAGKPQPREGTVSALVEIWHPP